MPWSRPLAVVGDRCHELRIRDGIVTWRIVYQIEADAIVILDVFSKKTRKIPQVVIARCRERLKAYKDAQGQA